MASPCASLPPRPALILPAQQQAVFFSSMHVSLLYLPGRFVLDCRWASADCTEGFWQLWYPKGKPSTQDLVKVSRQQHLPLLGAPCAVSEGIRGLYQKRKHFVDGYPACLPCVAPPTLGSGCSGHTAHQELHVDFFRERPFWFCSCLYQQRAYITLHTRFIIWFLAYYSLSSIASLSIKHPFLL